VLSFDQIIPDLTGLKKTAPCTSTCTPYRLTLGKLRSLLDKTIVLLAAVTVEILLLPALVPFPTLLAPHKHSTLPPRHSDIVVWLI
jgi:hypothetical protein